MISEIQEWLRAGADLGEGVRLFSKYGSNEAFAYLLAYNPGAWRQQLFNELVRLGGADPVLAESKRRFFAPTRQTFRNEWPFLNDPECPVELKILATDKISAWRRYVDLHEQLFDCTNPEECFRTASGLLAAYMENRDIHAEFAYYKEHGQLLARHPIFASFRRIRELKKKSVLELVTIRKRLEGNIWRVKNEMAKGDRPDLLPERQRRLALREAGLKEVNDILIKYE